MATGVADVPDDVLAVVAEHLSSLADSLRFGAVCRSWASAAARIRRPSRYLPCLLVPEEDMSTGGDESDDGGGGGGGGTLYNTLFCVSGQKAYHGLQFPEESRHWRCCGSSHAWLGMVDSDCEARLLNPMSGAQVVLPNLSTFPKVIDVIEWPPLRGAAHGGGEGTNEGTVRERCPLLYVFDWLEPEDDTPADQVLSGYVPFGFDGVDMRDLFIFKMIVSSPEPLSDPKCVIMAIYGDMRQLAYCKPGDSMWTALETSRMPFEDVIFHRGKFYAAKHDGRVLVVEEDITNVDGVGYPRSVREVAPPPLPIQYLLGQRKYLVGLPSGRLLFVSRDLATADIVYRTEDFQVFELDIDSSRPQWRKVENLGRLALFLGHNSSVCVPFSGVPGSCRANCIYFTDDYLEGYYGQSSYGGHDMGIFNMGTKSIERYYASDSQLIMPPPVWILPNPK